MDIEDHAIDVHGFRALDSDSILPDGQDFNTDIVSENLMSFDVLASHGNASSDSLDHQESATRLPSDNAAIEGEATSDSLPISVAPSDTGSSSIKKGKPKKSMKRKSVYLPTHDNGNGESYAPAKRWERRKVQIKTLEGEFSVMIWASGL